MIQVQVTLEDGATPARVVRGSIFAMALISRGCKIVRGSPSNLNVPPEWDEHYADIEEEEPKKSKRPRVRA